MWRWLTGSSSEKSQHEPLISGSAEGSPPMNRPVGFANSQPLAGEGTDYLGADRKRSVSLQAPQSKRTPASNPSRVEEEQNKFWFIRKAKKSILLKQDVEVAFYLGMTALFVASGVLIAITAGTGISLSLLAIQIACGFFGVSGLFFGLSASAAYESEYPKLMFLAGIIFITATLLIASNVFGLGLVATLTLGIICSSIASGFIFPSIFEIAHFIKNSGNWRHEGSAAQSAKEMTSMVTSRDVSVLVAGTVSAITPFASMGGKRNYGSLSDNSESHVGNMGAALAKVGLSSAGSSVAAPDAPVPSKQRATESQQNIVLNP